MLMPVSVLGLRLDYINCRHSVALQLECFGRIVVKNQYQMHSAG